MCCGGSDFPNRIGVLISTLSGGDEVIILKGQGTPEVKKDTLTLIWKVDKFSALTVDGISLTCQNAQNLMVTGNSFETYEVSAKALLIWGETIASEKKAKSPAEPDWTVPVQFSTVPE